MHTTSPAESAGIAALGFGDRVRMIPLGADAPRLASRKIDSRTGPLRLLFLSRLHPKKGLPLLLDALADLNSISPSVQLTVAGGGATAYRRELETRCRILGIENQVNFVGHVERERKAAVFNDADVYVLPSYQENFGIAVTEAMAAGLPVIVSDQVGLADTIRAAGAGRVVPCEVSAIARAIADLEANPAMRQVMGENATALVRDHFSWGRTCRLLLNLYEQIAFPPLQLS